MRFARAYVLAFQSLLLALVLFSPSGTAQIPPVSSTTSTPIPGAGHDYLGGINETVNPATGSVSIRIPVIMPPSRGIALPFTFAYDSNAAQWLKLDRSQTNGTGTWLSIPTIASQGGWSNSVPIASSVSQNWTTQPEGAPKPTSCYSLINFEFQDARGSRHNLDLTNYSFVNNPNGACATDTWDWPYYFTGAVATQGGEGPILASIPTPWSSTPTVTVTDGDGTTLVFPLVGNASKLPTSVTDRNGNTITVNSSGSSSGYTALSYVDTSGRTVLQDSGFAVSPETVTISGLGASYSLTWTTLPTPTFTTPITTLSGTCAAGHGGIGKAVSSLTLPNGKSFSFTYDSVYGLVNKITYPSGGYVRYVWGMNAQAEYAANGYCSMEYGVPAVTDRYVSFDGTHEVLHQTFAYSTTWPGWSAKQTTVTTYDLVRNTNFQTIYAYNASGADTPPNSAPVTQWNPIESSVAYHDTSGSLLKTVNKTWANVRLLASQQTTFPNNQVSKTTWTYNSNEMQTEQDDYDFGNGAPGNVLRATVTNYATSTAMGANHVVDKPSNVIVYSDSAKTNKVAETDYTYDNPVGTVTSGIVQHSAGCNCGSLTQESHWLNSGGTTLSTTFTNDDTGQRLSMTDPRGNQTTYSYADNYSSGTPPGPTNAYLTQVTHPQTGGVNHIEHFAYAYASGEVTSSTDQNNLVTTYKYIDNLARLTETDFPDGGVTSIAYNDNAYNPNTPSPSVTTTKSINTSTNLVTLSAMDGLGHPVTSLVTSDPQGTIHTDTTYDGLGRAYTVSNPYRTGGDPTTSSGTTTLVYDAIGRKITETAPDNSVITTAYCAGSTLVTDPTGKWRRSRVDGLGRLVEVDEPNAPGATVNSNGCPGTGEPIWVTSYTLDTLGNLKTVLQNSSHQRNFTYDWASRLLTAQNPESGTITYNYDSDANCSSPNSFAGLLVSKIDARGIRTCAQYDALNRETVLNYSNGDATITTTYDQSACLGLSACQNIGQRTSLTDAAGSESWAYQVDATNHRSVHVNQRTTSSITKTSTYYLDLAGNVTQAVYPTGRVVNYTFDAANRPKTAADGSNGITYATDFQSVPTGCISGAVCYTPQGTFYALSIGQATGFTGLNLTHTYNNRLQPNEFKASSSGGNAIDISYNFVDPSTSKNAGHVYGITNNLDTTRSQTFTYDQLNRITSALTTSTHTTSPAHCWGETYTLDTWANLNSIAATTNSNYTGCTVESGFSTTADANNHLPVFGYDLSGNTSSDGFVTNYQWDAESQLKSAAGATYTYDGEGRRVAKVGSKLYWYGSGGDILAETNTSGAVTAEYIFFGGKRIAMLPAGGNPAYYVEDMLGTSRVLTTNTGVVCYDADFYPYGGERTPYTNNCPTTNNYKFEGKERDTETGNDDFGARYYSNRFGRWLSADWSSVPVPVPYANLTNPQTLNLYSMVADDPESFADLDGHDPQNASSASQGTRCAVDASSCSQQEREQLRVAKANATNDEKPKPAAQQSTKLTLEQMQQVVNLVANIFTIGALEAANMGGGDSPSTAPSQETTVVETAAATTAEETAAARANTIAATYKGVTADKVTIAVAETAEGVRVVGSSENDRGLRPAALAALKQGEVAVEGQGHAEVTVLNGAKQMGLTPTGVAASKPICGGCWPVIKAVGAAALSALKRGVLP